MKNTRACSLFNTERSLLVEENPSCELYGIFVCIELYPNERSVLVLDIDEIVQYQKSLVPRRFA